MSGLPIFPMTAGIFDDDQSEPSDQASYYFILTISVGYADLQAELLIDKDGFISGARFHLTERRYWYPARLNRWVE